jgi:Protein of unknown function (DUF3634)
MVLFLQLGLVALVAWALWTAVRPRCAFVVRIKGGVPRVARGTVTRSFLQEIAETCGRHGVDRGAVRGVVKGRRLTLTFTGGMPPPCQQQLRNLWELSGWSVGTRRQQR